jgi:hypothetical protein
MSGEGGSIMQVVPLLPEVIVEVADIEGIMRGSGQG